MIALRQVKPSDLDDLIRIENEGFSVEEAATKEALTLRIQMIPDTFIVAEKEGEIVGFINGPVIPKKYITDDLFEETVRNPTSGGYLSILGIVVSKSARKQGVAQLLLQQFSELSKQFNREAVTLTCKEELIAFYEKNGYTNEGKSTSTHGGETWYNLVKYR